MGKVRVRDLSAELGISNKALIQVLRELDIHVKSHMSGLTEEEADALNPQEKTDVQNVNKLCAMCTLN